MYYYICCYSMGGFYSLPCSKEFFNEYIEDLQLRCVVSNSYLNGNCCWLAHYRDRRFKQNDLLVGFCSSTQKLSLWGKYDSE